MVLAALFVLGHLSLGLQLTVENRKARPIKYAVKKSTGRGETFASKTMIYTGLWFLVFLIIHIINFRITSLMTEQRIMVGGVEMVDLYSIVMKHFESWENTAYYLLSIIALGIHLSHGFASAFQSLGFNHPQYTPLIKKAGTLFSFVITVGFGVVAIFCYLRGMGSFV